MSDRASYWGKFSKRFRKHLARKAENLEANGNPTRAATFREFWGLKPDDEAKPLKPSGKKAKQPKRDPVESLPKHEPMSKGWNRR